MASSTFVTVGVDVVAEGGVAMCTMGVDDDVVGAVAVKIAAVFMLSCVEKADVNMLSGMLLLQMLLLWVP